MPFLFWHNCLKIFLLLSNWERVAGGGGGERERGPKNGEKTLWTLWIGLPTTSSKSKLYWIHVVSRGQSEMHFIKCWNPSWMRLIPCICVSECARSIHLCAWPPSEVNEANWTLGEGAVSLAWPTLSMFNVEKFRRLERFQCLDSVNAWIYLLKLKWQLKVPTAFLLPPPPRALCKDCWRMVRHKPQQHKDS